MQDIYFDLKFEHSLFRSQSESDLYTVVLEPLFISFLKTKQKYITIESKSKKVEYQTKIEELNTTILKDIDEAIELAQLLAYITKNLVSQLYITIIPAVDSSLYAATSYIASNTTTSIDPFIPKLHLRPRVLFPPLTSSTISTSSYFDFSNTSFSFPSSSTYIPVSFPSTSTTAFSSSAITSSSAPSTSILPPSQAKLQAMAARYGPLVLPQQLHDMPLDY